MFKKILTIIIFSSILFFGLSVVHAAQTDTQYVPLEALPGMTASGRVDGSHINLAEYIPNLVKLAIGLAAALSVVYIIIGGFQYISTDAIAGKSAGKDTIKNAVFGLFLAIISVVILNTLNPRITDFNLDIKPTNTQNLQDQPITTTPDGSVSTTCTKRFSNGTEQTIQCTCNNCVNDPSALPFKPGQGTAMNRTLFEKLKYVNDYVKNENPRTYWYITEAWPPKVAHIDSCHFDGTCVDANLTPGYSYSPGSSPRAETIRQLNKLADALKSQGLNFVYEVNQADYDKLITAGFHRNIPHAIYQTTTYPSFHIEM